MVTNRSKVAYSGRSPSATLDPSVSYSYAYLCTANFNLKLGDDPVRPIDSKFGESVREGTATINRKSWKTQDTGASTSARNYSLLHERDAQMEQRIPGQTLCASSAIRSESAPHNPLWAGAPYQDNGGSRLTSAQAIYPLSVY